jgi:deoxyribodipyrimidine photolyase-related protein
VSALRVVLGDQLSPDLSALEGISPGDTVFMAEVIGECTYVRHHAKKLVLVLSAMRHFAEELRELGHRVDYVRLDDPDNTQTLTGEVVRAAARHTSRQIIATAPGEWRVREAMDAWVSPGGAAPDIRDDTRFLCTIDAFSRWAYGKRELRMEFFYRDMRRRHNILMDGARPAGGRWNYDAENRKRLAAGAQIPPPPTHPPDAVTKSVMAMVAARFPNHFGAVDGFDLPVTRAAAQAQFAAFLHERLPQFGDWQDAMHIGAPLIYHAGIAAALNIGLLNPLALCRLVEAEWREGRAPLNAAEGFIRQILGWREFVRGIYWLKMPGYAALNALGAKRKLPEFYWTGETKMRCLRETITDTRHHAYAHHIQRLMITGNFALLAGIDPAEVDDWYMTVYADAYEWVEMPNTRGMALFADGGIVGSKPYAASGAYINRMSNYCRSCDYDVTDATGPNACPFNALYWDFIDRHKARFSNNIRMAMPLRNLERMKAERLDAIKARAQEVYDSL